MSRPTPYILLAMSSQKRGEGLLPLARNLNIKAAIISEVEKLLLHLRTSTPAILILEDTLVQSVSDLDLISLLRRRDNLTSIPFVVLGTNNAQRKLSCITSGADLYVSLPTQPSLLQVYLKRLLERHLLDLDLREALRKLRDAEKNREHTEKVKEDLTHMLIHDLKSPIAAVMGLLDHSLEVLEEGDEHGLTELLALARGESQHLLNLAANILDVRRMRDGHMPYEPEWIDDLESIVKDGLRDATSTGKDRRFDILIKEEANQLYGDPKLLRRVFTNLFSNAIKHTRTSGHIDFRAWQEGDEYVLSVRDDGEGIPEADQKRIFKAFEQSRATIHERYDTGMGLTFCKMAVEKHGGKIWVESKVGKGSTFFMTIPVNIEEQVDVVMLD